MMQAFHEVTIDDQEHYSIVIIDMAEGLSLYVTTPSDGEAFDKIVDLIAAGAEHEETAKEIRGWLQPVMLVNSVPVVLFV